MDIPDVAAWHIINCAVSHRQRNGNLSYPTKLGYKVYQLRVYKPNVNVF